MFAKALLSPLVLFLLLLIGKSDHVSLVEPGLLGITTPYLADLLDSLEGGTTNKSKGVEVSAGCQLFLSTFVGDLRALRPSALQMLDAFGKIPGDLERGHLQWFGSYDECMRVPNGTANYCLTKLGSSDDLNAIRQSPALATCFPKECSATDVEGMINTLLDTIRRNLPVRIPQLDDIAARQAVCKFDIPIEDGLYVLFTVIGLSLLLCIFGTIVDWFLPRFTGNVERSESADDDEALIGREKEEAFPPRRLRVFTSFSVFSSWNYLTAERPNDLPFLDGMRVLSVCWVVLGSLFNLGQIVYENPLDYMDSSGSFIGQLITNASLAADTFFVLSGVVLTYSLLKKLEQNEGKLNWIWVYIRRWWRLTPLYAAVLMTFMYVVPTLVTGPFPLLVGQDTGGNPLDACKKYWWSNMLYINNFVPSDTRQQCLDWTWFLAVEMQLFIVTPPIVYILFRWWKAGLAILASLIVACLITSGAIAGHWGLPVSQFETALRNNATFDPNYDYITFKPYTRMSPYLLGMMVGYIFAQTDICYSRFSSRRSFETCCWIFSTGVAILSIFGLNNVYTSVDGVSFAGRVSWHMLSRFGFSLSVCWVIFACRYGDARPIRNFLKWRVWRPLSHLTYAVYLFHPMVLQYYLINQRDPFYYNALNMALLYFGMLFGCYLLAFVVAMTMEFPLRRLEKEIVR